jgi:hypothetical protein
VLPALAVCLLFTYVGVRMSNEKPVVGPLTALFSGVCSLVFLISLHPRARSLTLREDGFEYTNLFRKHFVKWTDVSGFGIVSVAMNTFVSWNYSSSFTGGATARKAAKSLAGYEASLPDTYGMSAAELLEILTSVHAERVR